ncbi:TPA: MFS transporter [Vibrio cholerae]
MTKNNTLVLISMFLSCIGMFIFFPFITSFITFSLGIEEASVGTLLGISIFIGNVSALLFSLNCKPNKERWLFTLSIFFFIASIGGMFVISLNGTIAIATLLIGLISLYRFAIGIYFNSSRALQMRYLSDRESSTTLLSNIKLINSIAAGLGPVIGQYILSQHGYSILFGTSIVLFFLAFVPLLKTEKLSLSDGSESNKKRSFSIIKEKWFALSCLSGTLHFIFEAQIYTYLIFKANSKGIEGAIPAIFTTNSIALVSVGLLWIKYIGDINRHYVWIATASLFSLSAVLMVNWVESIYALIFISFVFSLGEFVSPQLRLDYASDSELDKLSVISVHNFFTGALGMSLGFALGGYLYSLNNVVLESTAWILVYCISVLLLHKSKTLKQDRGELITYKYMK